MPAADGFALPARILKPRGFDPARKYPAIVYIYGGPGAPTVNDEWDYSFAGNALFDQVLAARGYVVFSVDPRSATGQSKTLENADRCGRCRPTTFSTTSSQESEWLKAQPFVDPARVGVWGWSGGGTDTLLVMTRSDEFRAGIAVAPVTDWHFYDTKFTETYMKTPAENPDGYALFSLVPRAKDLHGRLLLVFGRATTTSTSELMELHRRARRRRQALRPDGLPDAQAPDRRPAGAHPPLREDAGVLEAVPLGGPATASPRRVEV